MKKILFTILATLSVFAYGQGPDCCHSFQIGADYLYWDIFQDNLEYAAQVRAQPGSQTFTDINSTVLSPRFKADSGFRVFADYNIPCTPWQIEANFTRLTSHAKRITNLNPATIATDFITLNSASFPVFNIVNQNNVTLSNLNAKWSSEVNYFDLDLKYMYRLCPRIDITPHLGFRAAWLKQRLRLNGVSPLNGGVTVLSNFNQNFNGYGIEGGLTANWLIGCGFFLRGHVGGSLLYSKISLRESIILRTPESALRLTVPEKVHRLCPMVDGFLGLGYQNSLCSLPYELHVGWEQHIIMHSNHFAVFHYSDLTLQGLTVGGNIGF